MWSLAEYEQHTPPLPSLPRDHLRQPYQAPSLRICLDAGAAFPSGRIWPVLRRDPGCARAAPDGTNSKTRSSVISLHNVLERRPRDVIEADVLHADGVATQRGPLRLSLVDTKPRDEA